MAAPGTADDDCPPLTPFYIQFNNQLDLTSFSEEMLLVSPEIPGVSANAYGNSHRNSGRDPWTNHLYRDRFGQMKDILARNLATMRA
jgi:hypothetical protein